MKYGRAVVGGLGGAAALFAFSVGAVSLTRIAGDSLGFPPGMEWTLTAAVDVAGTAGAAMWTGFTGQIRRIGRPMNIVCTLVSGIGVGLDHATHAAPGWELPAFVVGMLLPILVTWILHGLAVMLDRQTANRETGDREAGTGTVTRREATPRPPNREAETVAVETSSALVATTGTPDREAVAAGSEDGGATTPLPRVDLAPVSAQRRPDWITDELLTAVVESIRDTDGGRKNYGVPSVVRDHRLPDGRKIGSHRAGVLLAHADELLEVAS